MVSYLRHLGVDRPTLADLMSILNTRLQANAMERTRLVPDAALLLQEHLAALPTMVDALGTRLASAEEAATNRDGQNSPPKAESKAGVPEQLEFWTEKASARASKNASQVGREGDVVSRERHAESTNVRHIRLKFDVQNFPTDPRLPSCSPRP